MQSTAIPNIDLTAIYKDLSHRSGVQYETLHRLAEIMGRAPLPHRHDNYLQLHLIADGSYWLRLDNQEHEGVAPVLFLTPPSVPHAFSISPDATGHVLTVQQDLFWQWSAADHALPNRETLTPLCIPLAGEGQRQLAADLDLCFQLLGREIRSGRTNDTAVRALAAAILAKVFSLADPEHQAAPAALNRLALYRRFLELVEIRFPHHWPIARYAEALGMTQSRLYDLCQACAQVSPKTIINQRLVHEIRRYLAFSNASIKQISGALGFQDQNYFFRFFKQMTGETPGAYRSSIRKSGEVEKVQ